MLPCPPLSSAAAAGFAGAAVVQGQTHLSLLRGAERSCCSLQPVFVAAEWSHWVGSASCGSHIGSAGSGMARKAREERRATAGATVL